MRADIHIAFSPKVNSLCAFVPVVGNCSTCEHTCTYIVEVSVRSRGYLVRNSQVGSSSALSTNTLPQMFLFTCECEGWSWGSSGAFRGEATFRTHEKLPTRAGTEPATIFKAKTALPLELRSCWLFGVLNEPHLPLQVD
jgi:hypothetical protein